MRRRLAAVGIALLALLGLQVLAAGSASADLNPFDDIPGKIESFFCPKKVPPSPVSPGLVRPTKDGSLYGQYGYPPLYLTTYDQGCWAQVNQGIGTEVNSFANSLDELTNDAFGYSLDPASTSATNRVLGQVMPKLRDAFWTPGLAWAVPLVGLMILGAYALGSSSAVVTLAANAALVLLVVPFALGHPDLPTKASSALTTGAATRSASTLLGLTPGQEDVDPHDAFTSSYWTISYRAWLDQSFGPNLKAQADFGQRLLGLHAYSFAEQDKINADEEARDGIDKAKSDDWPRFAADLQRDHPDAYAVWSGKTGTPWNSITKHLFVSLGGLLMVGGASLGILAMRHMLELGLLLLAAFGFLCLLLRTVSIAMARYLLTALVGAPLLSVFASVIMFWNYAIISDPGTSWANSVIAVLALVVAVVLSLRFLPQVVLGGEVAEGSARGVGRLGRKARRRLGRIAGHGGGTPRHRDAYYDGPDSDDRAAGQTVTADADDPVIVPEAAPNSTVGHEGRTEAPVATQMDPARPTATTHAAARPAGGPEGVATAPHGDTAAHADTATGDRWDRPPDARPLEDPVPTSASDARREAPVTNEEGHTLTPDGHRTSLTPEQEVSFRAMSGDLYDRTRAPSTDGPGLVGEE